MDGAGQPSGHRQNSSFNEDSVISGCSGRARVLVKTKYKSWMPVPGVIPMAVAPFAACIGLAAAPPAA